MAFSQDGSLNHMRAFAAFEDPTADPNAPRLLKVIAVDQNGVQLGGASAATYGGVTYEKSFGYAELSASGDTELVAAPAAGSKHVLTHATFTNNDPAVDNTVYVKSDATQISASKFLEARGGANVIEEMRVGSDGEALNVNLSNAGAVSVDYSYITVPV